MDFQNLQKQVRNARFGRNALAVVSASLFVMNGLLAVTIYRSTNQVILIPTSISDGMVARGAQDKRYIEALALDTIYGLYNSSPNNLRYGREVIERVASVSHRVELLKKYDAVSQDIKARDISTVFFPRQIVHQIDNLEVIVEGDLQTFLNTVQVNTERRKILLTFVVEAGSVRLSQISKLEAEQ